VWNAKGPARARGLVNRRVEAQAKYDARAAVLGLLRAVDQRGARVEGLAAGGQILMTRETLEAVRAHPGFGTAVATIRN
jgi:hypothetical protein